MQDSMSPKVPVTAAHKALLGKSTDNALLDLLTFGSDAA
jgi:hypothetical protein